MDQVFGPADLDISYKLQLIILVGQSVDINQFLIEAAGNHVFGLADLVALSHFSSINLCVNLWIKLAH